MPATQQIVHEIADDRIRPSCATGHDAAQKNIGVLVPLDIDRSGAAAPSTVQFAYRAPAVADDAR